MKSSILSEATCSSELAIPKPYHRISNPNNIFDAMAFAYVVKNQGGVHFVTFTVHQWVDVFTRQTYVDELIDSLRYCQKEKAWKSLHG
ncbi:MAG TPA: hypothetical protein VGB63_14765 [Pedobacter sp.]|jgi:SAM-dependent MidA family methyltransferase